MARIEFGLFDWIDRSTAPLHQLYKERLQLLTAADQAGFFCYHLAEHHARHGAIAGVVPRRRNTANQADPPLGLSVAAV